MWLLYVACSMCLLFSNPYNMSYCFAIEIKFSRTTILICDWELIYLFFVSQNNLIAVEINFLSQNINSLRWIILQFDTRSHLIWDIYNSSFTLEHQVCNIIIIHYISSVFLLSTMYSRIYLWCNIFPCLPHVEINYVYLQLRFLISCK